ncbi:NAD-dependent epimerase/dehydratase family protein [Streptomyces sp. NPDC057010]|uniref:NAD-dependent epimerase/dehydratase family protein n=1 Tax=Streptomyces sp. NPDC057010 TaxID=3345997 RepID=UPI00362EF5C8
MITGGSGFIGSALTQALRIAGHTVSPLDNLSVTSTRPRPQDLQVRDVRSLTARDLDGVDDCDVPDAGDRFGGDVGQGGQGVVPARGVQALVEDLDGRPFVGRCVRDCGQGQVLDGAREGVVRLGRVDRGQRVNRDSGELARHRCERCRSAPWIGQPLGHPAGCHHVAPCRVDHSESGRGEVVGPPVRHVAGQPVQL